MMWQPVALPFKSDSLPESLTLPSTDEIRACPNILWERSTAKVVAVNDEIVVKFGAGIELWEGQALLYLERYVPNVPAPRLYAMYYDGEQLFMIMQRAPGVPLDSIWESLAESEKDDITAKIRDAIDTLRQAKSPWPDLYGGLDGGSIHHYLFWCRKAGGRFLGPYHGEVAFVAGLTNNYRVALERSGSEEKKPYLVVRMRLELLVRLQEPMQVFSI